MYPAVVFARLSSSRLPGKALLTVNGITLIDFVFQTLEKTDAISDVLLATSTDDSDTPLVEHAVARGLSVFRGSLKNPSNRLCEAMKKLSTEAVFRVNGDSPFINKSLFSQAADVFARSEFDLVTNVFPRTYPPGISVELIRTATYLDIEPKLISDHYREHITTYFYENPNAFKILNLTSSNDLSACSLAVDTPEDFERFAKIVKSMDRHHSDYTVDEIIEKYVSVRAD